MAPTMVDVVRYAGGLLVDRVLAGWEATVLVADRADSRPLRILGAAPVQLEAAFASPEGLPAAEELAVEAELCDTDQRVRQLVQDALSVGSADVRLWGGPSQTRTATLEHRLSVAARAFKAQALAAASARPVAIDVETFDTTVHLGAAALAGAAPSAAR